MLRLATVDLFLPSSEWELSRLEEWVDRNIDPDLYRPWLRKDFPGHATLTASPRTGYYQHAPVRLNTFYFPTWSMSRWGYGHFLLSSRMVSILRDITGGSASRDPVTGQVTGPGGRGPAQPVSLAMSSAGSASYVPTPGAAPVPATFVCKVYVLCYVPLGRVEPGSLPAVPGPPPGPIGTGTDYENGLYLATVVDARYLSWFNDVNEIIIDDKSTPGTTWVDLLTQVAGNTLDKVVPSVYGDPLPPVPPATAPTPAAPDPRYLAPSKRFEAYSFQPVPPVFDAIAWNVGMRLTYDPVNMTASFMTAKAAGKLLGSEVTDYPGRTVRAGGVRHLRQL